MTNLPTGWHPDPKDPSLERWWDSASGKWLDHSRAAAGGGPTSSATGEGSTPQWANPPAPPTTYASPSARRWAELRKLNTGPLVVLVILFLPFVIAYLLPWELWWKKFRQLPGRTQVITGGALVVVLVVLGIVGAVTESAQQSQRADEKADVAKTTTSTTTTSVTRQQEAAGAAPPQTTTATTSAPPPPPQYPGAKDNDAVANARGEVEVRGLTAIVGPLRRIAPVDFDGPRLCADLTFQNRSNETEYYNTDLDFSIQSPSGNEKGVVIGYANNAGSGNLVAGGRTSGQVCFIDPGEAGQYLVLWDRTDTSSFSTPRRGVWIFNLR